MRDVLRSYVPEYKGQVTSDDGERKWFACNTISVYLTSI